MPPRVNELRFLVGIRWGVCSLVGITVSSRIVAYPADATLVSPLGMVILCWSLDHRDRSRVTLTENFVQKKNVFIEENTPLDSDEQSQFRVKSRHGKFLSMPYLSSAQI